MRDIVNKGLTNEELLRGVKTAWEQGWDKIKLYFMIGLPGETDADVLGIVETVAWLQRECRAKGRKPLSFNLTISNFTPKPHTPFQWHSVSTDEFKRKQNLLRQEFRRIKGVKVNFTDVRLSAMEDFIGRGDRSLASVLRRAWELGAGMDAWYDSIERAFNAWGDAIAEAGLTWKYRQVENGEWNLMEARGERRKARSERLEEDTFYPTLQEGESPTAFIVHPSLDAPLPWDYIDTGIDKQWLKADLERAYSAATVPDCSFDGCSHCGVCGTDFGHNIVIEPPSIPQFAGHFVPNNTKVQRLRVWFGKLGDMALVSHLDLLRLFDRAVRRAALPISFTNGFHPSPRISITQALPLGVTSSGEIVDFELTQQLDPETFRQKLSSQLPGDIPIYQVTPIELKDPSATKILSGAEYLVTVATQISVNWAQWQEWVEKVKGLDTIWWEQTTKSGKTQMVNLRDRLFELEVVEPHNRSSSEADDSSIVLRYLGSCQQDGNKLRPEHIIYMLEQVAQVEFQILHIHRNRLILESS